MNRVTVKKDRKKNRPFPCTHVLPANKHIFGVEPRGFEPLTSAVKKPRSTF